MIAVLSLEIRWIVRAQKFFFLCVLSVKNLYWKRSNMEGMLFSWQTIDSKEEELKHTCLVQPPLRTADTVTSAHLNGQSKVYGQAQSH